jgi:hypothetical protein
LQKYRVDTNSGLDRRERSVLLVATSATNETEPPLQRTAVLLAPHGREDLGAGSDAR